MQLKFLVKPFFSILALFAFICIGFFNISNAEVNKKIIGYIAYWDQARGINTVEINPDLFTEISINWYTLDQTGDVIPYRKDSGATYVDLNIINSLRSKNILIVPTIQNSTNSNWDGQLVSNVISNSTLRTNHVTSIVDLVVANGYDGIDIDYEELFATDRANFSTFIQELATALHSKDKILSVSVYPKTSELGNWAGPQAQDWSAIGSVADEVRIMIYGYSWQTSIPGPIAPIDWVNQVLAYAKTTIPNHKLIHGIPSYGIDWVDGGIGEEKLYDTLATIANDIGTQIKWDNASKTPWFQYSLSGINHTVWFENASSTEAKVLATINNGTAGVSIWRLGGEDLKMWSVVRNLIDISAPPIDLTPPVVEITSPKASSTVSKTVSITVSAIDEVGISKVEFYINNKLLSIDTTFPYSTNWNTNPVKKGNHEVKVIAYDTSNNTATQKIIVKK